MGTGDSKKKRMYYIANDGKGITEKENRHQIETIIIFYIFLNDLSRKWKRLQNIVL
jgi:hypothetical protein